MNLQVMYLRKRVSGTMGLRAQLTAGEILEQLLHATGQKESCCLCREERQTLMGVSGNRGTLFGGVPLRGSILVGV